MELSSTSPIFSPKKRGAALRLARFDDGSVAGGDRDLFLFDRGVIGDKTFFSFDLSVCGDNNNLVLVCVVDVMATPLRFFGCLAMGPEDDFLFVLGAKNSRLNVERDDAEERVVGVVSHDSPSFGAGVARVWREGGVEIIMEGGCFLLPTSPFRDGDETASEFVRLTSPLMRFLDPFGLPRFCC